MIATAVPVSGGRNEVIVRRDYCQMFNFYSISERECLDIEEALQLEGCNTMLPTVIYV